jgi:hypothetical protein
MTDPQVGYLNRRDPTLVLRSVLGMRSVSFLAGTVSTVLFALSTLPMLIKAARTNAVRLLHMPGDFWRTRPAF